jgi:hypothetical protein
VKKNRRPVGTGSSTKKVARKKQRYRDRSEIFGPGSDELSDKKFMVRLDRLLEHGRPKSPTNRHLSESYRRWLEQHRQWLEQRNPAEAKMQQGWDEKLARRKQARRKRRTR